MNKHEQEERETLTHMVRAAVGAAIDKATDDGRPLVIENLVVNIAYSVHERAIAGGQLTRGLQEPPHA